MTAIGSVITLRPFDDRDPQHLPFDIEDSVRTPWRGDKSGLRQATLCVADYSTALWPYSCGTGRTVQVLAKTQNKGDTKYYPEVSEEEELFLCAEVGATDPPYCIVPATMIAGSLSELPWISEEIIPPAVWDTSRDEGVMRPVKKVGDALHYLDPRGFFLWDPKLQEEAEGLVPIGNLRTIHRFANPATFQPTHGEVIAQLPVGLCQEAVAYQLDIYDSQRPERWGDDYHTVVTTFYKSS